ncbi:MAG: hypothetical protein ACRBDL_02465 [Alphaproteobacteria bacterium]
MKEEPRSYNLYLSKIQKDKMIFGSNLLLLRQRLVIDCNRRCVSYHYTSPWRSIAWDEPFEAFASVESYLRQSGPRKDHISWFTNLCAQNGKKIPIKPSFWGLIGPRKATDFSKEIAKYLEIPHEEYYDYL